MRGRYLLVALLVLALGAGLFFYSRPSGRVDGMSIAVVCSQQCAERGYRHSATPAANLGERSCTCSGTPGKLDVSFSLDAPAR